MITRHPHRTPGFAAAAGLILLLAAGTALGDDVTRTFRFDGETLELADMIGAVEVTAATGDAFEVTVHVQGKDAAEDVLQFAEEQGGDAKLAIRFPLDDHSRYVYPALGQGKTTIHFRDEDSHETSWLKKVFGQFEGKKITVSGDGRGLELWADVTVAVPRGGSLTVRHGVGRIGADGVRGDLDLDTHTGGIMVTDLEGDLRADTGSGSVVVAGVRGDVLADTGSGGVGLTDVKGDKIHVDTGSGMVKVDKATCRDLYVDTGSGGVRARNIDTDQAKIDTGSGGVTLSLDRMGEGRFLVDTGSGSINFELPTDASATISADTGSGSIHADVAGARIVHKENSELQMVVGDGKARVTLDAGSGGITIRGL